MKNIDKDEFERLHIEPTKVINPEDIRITTEWPTDEELRSYTLDELIYMLEYEDYPQEVVEKIKYYITLKK